MRPQGNSVQESNSAFARALALHGSPQRLGKSTGDILVGGCPEVRVWILVLTGRCRQECLPFDAASSPYHCRSPIVNLAAVRLPASSSTRLSALAADYSPGGWKIPSEFPIAWLLTLLCTLVSGIRHFPRWSYRFRPPSCWIVCFCRRYL